MKKSNEKEAVSEIEQNSIADENTSKRKSNSSVDEEPASESLSNRTMLQLKATVKSAKKNAVHVRRGAIFSLVFVTVLLSIYFSISFFGAVSDDRALKIAYNQLKSDNVNLDNYYSLTPKKENRGYLIIFRPLDTETDSKVIYIKVGSNGKITDKWEQSK